MVSILKEGGTLVGTEGYQVMTFRYPRGVAHK